MGMDVHGLNPKENANIDDFPIIKKYNKMKFEDKWKELGADDNLQKMYWKEQEDWEEANPGVYFRNNCWWWRPLWNYCYWIAEDIISEELWDSGHTNSGAGLDAKDSVKLGERLLDSIADGTCLKYQADYLQHMEDSDDEFAKSYPFDVDNVKDFAKFCIESGGFEIC